MSGPSVCVLGSVPWGSVCSGGMRNSGGGGQRTVTHWSDPPCDRHTVSCHIPMSMSISFHTRNVLCRGGGERQNCADFPTAALIAGSVT